MDPTIPIVIASVAAVFLCFGAVLDDRRARVRRRAARVEIESAVPLLHSINDDRCIGCEACIDVCPTEVLDLVDHKVKVARFSDCVQCEQCANACPTQALVMYREGTTPRMLTVPELDENFQTGVPGQYLIGEVAGKPLVKNAANLGRAVVEHIARTLHGTARPTGDVVDVAIVGSGPAGLSAGLTCVRRHLTCVVLEKEHVISSTVSRYPKGKTFMAEPCTSKNVSFLPVFDGTKEELVSAWQKVVEGARLPIRHGEACETVVRDDDGLFTIKTTVARYRARNVVLATGLRGKPRLLVVPGANLEKVQSLLDDPAEFAGEDVLVVGGGDSAVEGAMALADAGARVTLSYRGDGFKRCKSGNQKRLAEMTASSAVTVHLESNVTELTPDAVALRLRSGEVTTIPNQRAFVLIGADTPTAWLETNHVRFVERPHLYALGSTEEVVRRMAGDQDVVECATSPDEALAAILGHPHKPSKHRMRSMVGHLADEFRDVVTSVSTAFRLDDEALEQPRRGQARTPARGVIPATRLVKRAISAAAPGSPPPVPPLRPQWGRAPTHGKPETTQVGLIALAPRAVGRDTKPAALGDRGTSRPPDRRPAEPDTELISAYRPRADRPAEPDTELIPAFRPRTATGRHGEPQAVRPGGMRIATFGARGSDELPVHNEFDDEPATSIATSALGAEARDELATDEHTFVDHTTIS